MLDYSTWTNKPLNVTDLRLDSKNPRIPPADEPWGQPELIHELVEHDDILEMAGDISQNGFFPTESVVVVEEDGEMVVIEGNRRVAALKLMLDPNLAPEEYVKRFRGIAAGVNPKGIEKVNTWIAPSREAAVPLILARHTGEMIVAWKPIQQSRYYMQLLKQGATEDDLKQRYGITSKDIADARRASASYDMACALDLPDEVKKKVHNPRSFPYTNLKRALESASMRELLGLEFDATLGFIGNIDKDEFKKGYAKLITDVATKEEHSRTLNSEVDFKRYVKQFGPSTPDKSKMGKFTPAEILGASPLATTPMSPKKKTPRTAKPSRSIVPRHVKSYVSNPRINKILTELKGLIPVEDYVNANAVLLRTFIEFCVDDYIHRAGKVKALLAYARDPKRPPGWYPTLKYQLQFLAEVDVDARALEFEITPLAFRAMKKYYNRADNLLNLDTFDAYVHNKNMVPTEADLRALWTALEPMVVFLLSNKIAAAAGTTP